MKRGVTIQDLANSLGMSRNTVSKALNGQHVPLKTRNAVISAAIEMGYKGYKLASVSDNASLLQKRILILSSRLLMSINYYVFVLRGIEEALTDYNFELVQFNITSTSTFSKLKRYLENNRVDGIICIEFFNQDYIRELAELGIPIVFLDFPANLRPLKGHYDIILPESQEAVKLFCMDMLRENTCKTFGFVGDYMHCRSFQERFLGMMLAVGGAQAKATLDFSIMHDDSAGYSPSSLQQILQEMSELPDCFIAANDSIAVNLLAALKACKKHVPKDIKVIGFDNSPEAKMSVPTLTTFNVNKTVLGRQIISILMDRIKNPTQANMIIHISSKLVVRGST